MSKITCELITCVKNDGKGNCINENVDLKYVDDMQFLKEAKMPDGSSLVKYIGNNYGHFMGLACRDLKWMDIRLCHIILQVGKSDYIGGIMLVKSILWKYDDELGWAYFCPNCKLFLCGNQKKCECGQEIDWNNPVEYKGKVKWI